MPQDQRRKIDEQQGVIEDLRTQNEKLLMQILKLMQNAHAERGSEEPHGIFKFQESFNEFIKTISSYINDEDLYQVLADEILRNTKADRVSIVVQGGSVQRSLVVTHIASDTNVPEVPIPYFVSLDEEDPYKDFLNETIDSGKVTQKIWKPLLEIAPKIVIEESCAKAITIDDAGTWVICLQWFKADPVHQEIIGFFENMVRYATVVMEQSLLLSNVRELKEQQESIIESMPSAIIGLDFLGNVTIWNGKAEAYFGIPEEAAIGQPFGKLMPDFSFIADSLMETVSSEEEEIVFDYVVHTNPNGKQCYLQPHLYNMLNSNRGELALRIDDITQQINLQHQLLHAQKMETVGTLAGGMAHDFNNILGGIVGTVSLMKKRWAQEGPTDAVDVEDVETIDHCTKRASDLVSRLLDLSRKSDQQMKKMDLINSLGNVIKIIRGSFDSSIHMSYDTDLDKAWVLGEKSQVENGILNLCVNARDAMKEGGELKIGLKEFIAHAEFREKHDCYDEEEFYCITVTDSGQGMDSETIQRMFQAFYTTKAADEGTGLGLAIFDKIIQDHQGYIDVISKPGEGTTFFVYLPVASISDSEHVEVHEEDSIEPEKVASQKVLVVDDDDVIRKLLVRIMESFGYEVVSAINGLDAVRVLSEEHPFELLILDIDMPGMNGIEVFKMFRQDHPHQKVLFCTGRSKQYNMDELLAMGTCMVIDKPFTVDEIEAVVETLVEISNE
ncbi:MAG: response regulator [Fibrobacterales bacterium]